MDHSARLRRLKDRLDGSCAVITDPMDIYYFTGRYMEGMERLVALVVSEEPLLVVPSLHDGETRDLGMERIVWHDGQDPFRMVAERVRGRPVLVQGKIPYSHVVRLGLRPEGLVDDIVSEMRSVKDSEELEAMSMAVSIAERSFRDLLDHIQEGMTEADLARYLEDRFRANGADGPSFSTIVCFGENAANPHHRPGNRRLKRGECIVVDFGCRYRGYASDTTRTLYTGKPDDMFYSSYLAVMEAQSVGVSSVSPERTGSQVDSLTRNAIERYGLGRYFIHRTGHGIGLEVHEAPYLDSNNTQYLRPGNVVTVEPGVYVQDRFGIRIEDMVLVTERGQRDLNRLTHDLVLV